MDHGQKYCSVRVEIFRATPVLSVHTPPPSPDRSLTCTIHSVPEYFKPLGLGSPEIAIAALYALSAGLPEQKCGITSRFIVHNFRLSEMVLMFDLIAAFCSPISTFSNSQE